MGIISKYLKKREEKTGVWPFKRKKPETVGEIEREIEHEERRLVVAEAGEFTSKLAGETIGAFQRPAPKGKKGRRRSRPDVRGMVTSHMFLDQAPQQRQPTQQRQPVRRAAAPQDDILSMDIGSGILGVQGGILEPYNFGNGSNNKKGKKKKSLDITNIKNDFI